MVQVHGERMLGVVDKESPTFKPHKPNKQSSKRQGRKKKMNKKCKRCERGELDCDTLGPNVMFVRYKGRWRAESIGVRSRMRLLCKWI